MNVSTLHGYRFISNFSNFTDFFYLNLDSASLLILTPLHFQIQGGQLSWDLTEHHLGDNLCHDYLNRPECLYDLGDCCQDDTYKEVEWTCYSCYCYPLDKGFQKIHLFKMKAKLTNFVYS